MGPWWFHLVVLLRCLPLHFLLQVTLDSYLNHSHSVGGLIVEPGGNLNVVLGNPSVGRNSDPLINAQLNVTDANVTTVANSTTCSNLQGNLTLMIPADVLNAYKYLNLNNVFFTIISYSCRFNNSVFDQVTVNDTCWGTIPYYGPNLFFLQLVWYCGM